MFYKIQFVITIERLPCISLTIIEFNHGERNQEVSCTRSLTSVMYQVPDIT